MVGIIRRWVLKQTVLLSVELVLLIASLILIYFLIIAFVRMSKPLFKVSEVSSTIFVQEKSVGFWSRAGKVFGLIVPSKTLERYVGIEHSEIEEKLAKHAPRYPKFELFGALITTGTAGGMIYLLLNQFVKNVFK